MKKNRSFINAYLLDGKGGGKSLSWEEVNAWQPGDGLLWVHLNFTVAKTKQWLIKEAGIERHLASALCAEESRPRSVIGSEGIFVALRGVNLNPGQDPEDMVSIRIWLEHNRIITTRKRGLLSVDDIIESIHIGAGPTTPAEFFVSLNEKLSNRISHVVQQIDDEVDQLEEEVMTSDTGQLRPHIADLRRQAISIRRYLSPQREALQRLWLEKAPLFDQDARNALREAHDRMVRQFEDLESARERAGICQEELTTRVADQMNKRMYLLAIVTVIFLPLSFVTGLLGINVGGVPAADSPWGFWATTGLLGVMALFVLVWLRRKKWL